MELLSKTIKSFTRKERVFSLVLLAILLFSFYQLTFSGNSTIGKSQGRIYSEGVVGEFKRLNPVFTEFNDADADVSSLIFSGLVRYNPATGEFEEDIATHTLSDDQLTYTFTLKNDVLWHDGTPVSAEDIYFTYAEVIQSGDFTNPVLKANFEGVLVKLENSRTVSFTLASPNSFFFSGLTVGLLPQHILGEAEISELDTLDFNKQPVGTGPYRIDGSYEFNSDSSMSVKLVAFENYYGNTPELKEIRFVSFPSIEELVANRSVWNGAARIRQSMLDQFDLDELIPYKYELPQYTALFLNTDSDLLARNKSRLGISKAIDKEKILEAIGFTAQIDTPLLELDQEEWLHTYSEEEAKGALFDAGWEEGDDGIRRNDQGEEFILRLARRDFSSVNVPQEETMSETTALIKQQLEAVGISVEVESYSIEDLQKVISDRDYDLLLYGQSLGYNLDTFSYWHSSQANESGLNLSNYQNPKADFNIEAIRETFDDEEREELLQNLGEIISTDVPAIFLYSPSYYYLVDTRVTGVNIQNILRPIDRFANIYEWSFN